MIYYVDFNAPVCGDGLTPESPRNDLGFEKKGDTVLFKRGSVYRFGIESVSGAKYGAYGEGEKPAFCGSVNLSRPDMWENVGENLWRCVAITDSEACNFIFNKGESFGALRWCKEDLAAQGDWFDTRIGSGDIEKQNILPEELLMYSVGNPAEFYQDIECAQRVYRYLFTIADDIVIEDLAFINGGVHGVSGRVGGYNVTVRRCSFRNIGGAVFNREQRIRFGNGVEIWDRAKDILVEDCDFLQIYDSCVTHQGGDECEIPENITFRKNRFSHYGMAAYECREHTPVNGEFRDNICKNAGCGFSMLGEDLPRRSEIWPQPMGHHLFMWRVYEPSPNGHLIVAGNEFGDAPNGAAIYSIMDPAATAQMELIDNRYTGTYLIADKLD